MRYLIDFAISTLTDLFYYMKIIYTKIGLLVLL